MELKMKNIDILLKEYSDDNPDNNINIELMKTDIIETIETLISYYTKVVVRDVFVLDIYSYPTDIVTDIILSYNQLMDYYNNHSIISNIFNLYLQ